MRLRSWLSDVKWLMIVLEGGMLWKSINNWGKLLLHFAFPFGKRGLRIELKNGLRLFLPITYPLEPIVETLVQNVYRLPTDLQAPIVVDIGASIGEFVILTKSLQDSTVYAFEPDPESFKWLSLNVNCNRFDRVILYNEPIRESRIVEVCQSLRADIDFLKVDCDGCEYGILGRTPALFRKIARIGMETHLPALTLRGRLVIHVLLDIDFLNPQKDGPEPRRIRLTDS